MPTKRTVIITIIVLIGVGAVVLFATWLTSPKQMSDAVLPESSAPEEVGSTTTTLPAPAQKTLPPEPAFVLPEGATAIDGYAYTEDNHVYFKSLTGKTPLAIQDANAERFKRLTDFITYPGTQVVTSCGAAPTYTFYGDSKRLYFYQVWRAPLFRTSRVEVVAGADPDEFSLSNMTDISVGKNRYTITYQPEATSTCALVIKKTP